MLVAELTKRYLPALDGFMRAVVDSAPEAGDFTTMLRYPLGWVDAQGEPYQGTAGKRIRPILLLLCAQAAGGDWHDALPAAAAVELLHNFSLIHDDIQDASPIRHDRPTVWKIWEIPHAINAGDTMFVLAYEALSRLKNTTTPEIALACWEIFNRTNLELTRGQHLDMRFEKQSNVTEAEYLSMVSGKTAALISASAQIGALIGGRDPIKAAHYAAFGLNLGIAFQIHDDILGIWGDESVIGKSTDTDIVSRKKSLPVLYGLTQSAYLQAIYQREPLTTPLNDGDVQTVKGALDTVGALSYTRESESEYYAKALDAVQQTGDSSGDSYQNLLTLSEILFDRKA